MDNSNPNCSALFLVLLHPRRCAEISSSFAEIKNAFDAALV